MDRGNEVRARYVGDVKIVSMREKFTKETTPRICQLIKGDLQEKGIKAVILDFAEVPDMDTTAFACMIDIIKGHLKDVGQVGLVNIKEKGREMLKILGLGNAIRVFESEKEALKALTENDD